MPHPLLYEINTRCWLRELSESKGHPITLAEVPEPEFRSWQNQGYTHIWLMGVWTGGPRARAQALNNPGLCAAYSEALPGWSPQDVAASPYAVSAYGISPDLGGEPGLKQFRQTLQKYGLKLILDFVPNHVGFDHPWVRERPELFVQTAALQPGTFAQETPIGTRYLAHGKDPNGPAWTDTVQLDYRRAETRVAMKGLLGDVAARCDGVRCDMAMLVLNEVFASTWSHFRTEESAAPNEFWADAISSTRRLFPGFLFLAEVYWGVESRLQALGFDYTYDKTLYDLLLSQEAGAVQRHLLGMPTGFLAASAHFLENHDERRIASALPISVHRAAALVILGLPGMRFLHEGQLRGLQHRLPVQLVRRAREPQNQEVQVMYDHLLAALRSSSVGQGEGRLLSPGQAWAGNPTAQHFVLVQWTQQASSFDLVVVNLAPHQSQCYAPLTVPEGAPVNWSLRDLLGEQRFVRTSRELNQRGLYLDLPANGAQILRFEPVSESSVKP